MFNLTETPRHDELKALDIDRLSDLEIYDNRAAFASAIILAIEEARDFQAESDCRAIGHRLREYAENAKTRLLTVTRP